MEKEVTKGYRYAVTAHEDGVTVTDANGLNLACHAGVQTYFVATGDTVDVTGDATLTQARGGIITGCNGGGEKIAAGEVVVGGTSGSVTIADLNSMRVSPVFLNGSELPEGVTLENLNSGLIGGSVNPQYCQLAFGTAKTYAFPYGALFAKYPGKRLPSTINLEKLTVAAYTFIYSELEEVTLSLPGLDATQIGMFANCLKLVKAEVTTPNMTSGNSMFSTCTSLSHFRGDLAKMKTASGMFGGCVLDLASVQHIVSTINNVTGVSGTHSITIGVDSNKVTQEQQDDANAIIVGKGWTVTWQRN